MEICRDTGFSVIYDSQKIFRIVLNCMARPGKINQLPQVNLRAPTGANPHILAILRTLLDQQVSFSVLAESPELLEAIRYYLMLNTGSFARELTEADFVYCVDGHTHDKLLNLKRGRVDFPEEGATIIYNVEKIIPLKGWAAQKLQLSSPTCLCLRGPGILEEQRIGLLGLGWEDEIVDFIKIRAPFPLGVDAIFVDQAGKVIGLPRTTSVEVQR